ncbi:hypothetical protein KEM60_02780 [Austwickia sp. TVS 96-490-7B]|uniref:pyridoxamine 5'-phosphate oxidase n=1 Tax=Austwickia sp. TVS 96-490-7B TaxID=2830843 RepID=UPI001C59085C|nr:pyridoxamine 5'-phosphate oxidase [Austwickia sp. TVS 96-490-7B]MBW3086553.1 hypothetical protein [Austwickia sp. TVS 96-490-7B]
MTIPVPLDDLAALLDRYGAGYLLTTSGAGRVKVVAVDPVGVGGEVLISTASSGSRANIAEEPQVTVMWPPLMPHGYTLIVDGVARCEPETIVVRPGHAILHRPSAHADGPSAPYPLVNPV